MGELREYQVLVNGHPMVQRLSEKDAARVGGTLVGAAIPPAGEGADSAGADLAEGGTVVAAVATKTATHPDEEPDQPEGESDPGGAKAATARNKARGAAGK